MSKKYFLFVLILLILVLTTVFLKFRDEYKQNIVIEYLNNKYGDGDWEIISQEEYAFYTGAGLENWYEPDGLRYVVSSSYTDNKPFHIYLNEKNMITEDCFLPTYYSIKYGFNYDFNTNVNQKINTDKFEELINRMVYITDYHYPYNDSEWTSSGWDFDRPRCVINASLMTGFFRPLSVQSSPKKEKLPDIIPDNQQIPELKEIIYYMEEFFSSERLKNENVNDDEFYKLVFEDKVSNEEIVNYISEHITPVNGVKIDYKYIRK